MLFSGFIFQIHTMPTPMQVYANAFPARYFIDISRALASGQDFSVWPAMVSCCLKMA
jgi:ABC-type polysaccharide/polyol phosphate export permease